MVVIYNNKFCQLFTKKIDYIKFPQKISGYSDLSVTTKQHCAVFILTRHTFFRLSLCTRVLKNEADTIAWFVSQGDLHRTTERSNAHLLLAVMAVKNVTGELLTGQ